MTGGKDGQNLFHRILPATVRGLTSTIAVDWHLKVKNIEYDVGLMMLTLLHYSLHAKNQFNSYTHSADFRVL